MKFSPSTGVFYPAGMYADDAIPGDAIDATEEQFHSAMARQPGEVLAVVNGVVVVHPVPASARWAARQAQARAELAANDLVATRCVKAGIAYPAAWRAYDAALRDIVRAASGDADAALPARPEYPSGS